METYSFVVLIIALSISQAFSLCWWSRCCPEAESVVSSLETDLSRSLFGQNLVFEPILTAISSHMTMEHPKKALVLSFHGPAGVGKTHVAKKIAHHLFGGEKHHLKFYNGQNDFIESQNINEHKERLKREISETVAKCPYAVFIFDESHRMSNGLFDVLRPYTDYYDQYQGVDYRRAIFIFLSNIGASEISDKYYKMNIPRGQLTLEDFEEDIAMLAFNKDGGYKDSTLVKNFLVDWYIPFLPLEYHHISECIKASLHEEGLNPTAEMIKIIYEKLPKKRRGSEEYVPSNCKRIHSEVGKFKANLQRMARSRKLSDEM